MQSTVNNPTLKIGSQGASVRELQELLNRRASRDYRIVVDGSFGPKTEALVKTLQHIYFLQVDGIVGSKTWKALYANTPVDMPILRRGSQGDLVKEVQKTLMLGNSQLKLAIDGIFGPQTEAAVKAVQGADAEVDRDNKVIVGSKTWNQLSGRRAFFTFD